MAGATYFRSGAGGSFLGFAALQRGRCAISYIHPNVPTPGPPTSRAVQVNLREGPSALRRRGRPVRTELETRLLPVMSLLVMRGIDRGVQPKKRNLASDATGFYGAVNLPPGIYAIVASFPGYPSGTNTSTVVPWKVTTQDVLLGAAS